MLSSGNAVPSSSAAYQQRNAYENQGLQDRQPTRLESLRDRMLRIVGALEEQNANRHQLIDQLLGSEPQPPGVKGHNGTDPAPSTITITLDMLAQRMDELLAIAQHQIDRLRTL